jgi:hypothetical protein
MEYSQQRKDFIERFMSNNTSYREPSNDDIRFDGRWDYLYQLNKVKKAKLDNMRKTQKQEEYNKDMSECTFNPKLNKSGYSSNVSYHGVGSRNSRGVNLPTLQDLTNMPLLDRQASWGIRKNIKLETIKNEQYMKEYRQCYFNPKIVRRILILELP